MMDDRMHDLLQRIVTPDDILRLMCEYMNKNDLNTLNGRGYVGGIMYMVNARAMGKTYSAEDS